MFGPFSVKALIDRLFLPSKKSKKRPLDRRSAFLEQLEAREMLYGYIQAQNDPMSTGGYAVLNTTAYTMAAPGVLANDSDSGGYPLTAHLSSNPSHGTVTLNGDGSFIYTANAGYEGGDSFTYYDTDTAGDPSSGATVSFQVYPGALSDVDQTKLRADTLTLPMQILGSSSGQPATAGNLSLVYHSSTAQPTQTLEQDWQPSMAPVQAATLDVSGTFNGTAQNTTYVNTSNLTGNNPVIRLSVDVNTSSLPTGRYADTQTVGQVTSYGNTPISVLAGAVNVVNDQSSPFGAGWEMPGLYHLYQNTASGVPAGVLLTPGDGTGWFFAAGSGNAYTSPNGPYAFDTLTSLSGGGWQLVDKFGTTYTFNSSGDLTSSELRTTATTTYGWASGDLTSITDPFGRSIELAYSGGLLSSITNFAGSVWSFAHSGSTLTSITQPTVAAGTPVWSFGYSGNLITSVKDPNSNAEDYAFNAYNNLSGDTLPGGAGESYTSEQNYGYGGSSQYQYTNAVLASSVQNSTTDPNGNTSYFTTDRLGDVLSYTDPYGNVTSYQRDANGLVTQLTEPPPIAGASAPVTTFTHDSLGNETSASGAHPSYGTTVYNSFSEPVSFTDSLNNKWAWSYDSHGNLLSETLPSNDTTSFTVDSLGNVLTMTQPAPNDGTGTVTTTYTRDSYERLTKITFPDNSTETFAYSTIDLPTSVTDGDNHTTATAYNALGQTTSVTAADGGVTAYTRDLDGNVLTTTDPMLNVTSNVWNSRNELVQQTLPPAATGDASPVLSWTYDANGNELTYTNALNEVTTETWDKLNRLASETLPAPVQGQAAPVTTFGYDNLSRKISETNALSGTTTWAYANTDVSQVTSMTIPPASGSGQGPTTSYFYDADGRQDQVENALGQFTTTTFTPDGQTASVKDNLGETTSYVYGHGQELLSTTDANQHTSSDQYDSRFRLVQTTDANNGVTKITLDGAGNETGLLDPANNQTTWTFSPVNLPLTETNALGTTTNTYNLDQELTSTEDADGRVRDFVYNNDQQLTAENWMSGSNIVATMAYGYDLAGELTSASDPNSAYAFAYNGDAEVTSVDNNGTPNVPHVVLNEAYDALGDRTSLSATIAGTADFLNNYTYNDDQELTAVTQQDQTGGNIVSPKEVDYGYNAIGQFTSVADFNFIGVGPRLDVLTGTFSYDTGARLTGIAYTSNGGADTIDTLGWGYDAANNVTSFSSIDGTATYAYDATNQLTSATYTTAQGGHQPANENFSFDKNGNRNMTGYSTGSDNLMSSDGTYNYQHDADGNTTVRTRISNAYATDYETTYTWDYRNRLTDVEYYDNNNVLTGHVHFVYDVFDHLIATEVDPNGGGTYTEIQHYVLDVSPEIPQAGVPGTALAQPDLLFDGNGNLIQRNLVSLDPAGVDAVIAQEAVNPKGNVVTWMAGNNLGSVVDVVDNTGALANHIVYASFGLDVYESNSAVRHWAGFAGGHADPNTGLVNNYHRWYDPATGRWISEDPKDLAGGDANVSRYLGNRPTLATDLTGLSIDRHRSPLFDPPGPPPVLVPIQPAPGPAPGNWAPLLPAWQRRIVPPIIRPPVPQGPPIGVTVPPASDLLTPIGDGDEDDWED